MKLSKFKTPNTVLILFSLILISLFIQLWRYNENNYFRLTHSEQGGWELVLKSGQCMPVEIGPTSVLTAWVMVLNCRAGQQHEIFVIFNDALPDKEYRALLATIKTSSQ